jgi:hypothetical protein
MTPAEWDNLSKAVDFLVERTGSMKTVIARSDLYSAVINYAWDTPLWVLQPRYSRNASRLREKAVLSILRDKGLVLGSEKRAAYAQEKHAGFPWFAAERLRFFLKKDASQLIGIVAPGFIHFLGSPSPSSRARGVARVRGVVYGDDVHKDGGSTRSREGA